MQISHFEKGARIPRVDVLEEWANALGLEVVIKIDQSKQK
jgi:hypothetical protein